MCPGGASRILRHNNVRNIIAKAVREIGLKTDIEHGGGLGDQRRPGDVIVWNWCEGKHLLIDVAVINPLALSHSHLLVRDGVGGPATAYENVKRQLYSDLDASQYEFVPFVLETCGGVGEAARSFCRELRKRRAEKIYGNITGEEEVYKYGDQLLTAVNVEVQRSNSQMILERKPVPEDLIESAFVKCDKAVTKRKSKAKDRVRAKRFSQNTKPVRKESHQELGRSLRSGLELHDVNWGLKESCIASDRNRGVKLTSGLLPDKTIFTKNLSGKDYPAAERVMAIHIQSTGLNTPTKALNPKSEIIVQTSTEMAMELECPQEDEPMHWEPPPVDVQGTVQSLIHLE